MGVAHLAFDLGPGRQRGHRVDDEDVERAGADQHVGDLERLLPGVGLGDEQVVDVDPDGPGVDRVHGVLGVDVGADAAVALRLGHHVHGQGGLPRGLRARRSRRCGPGAGRRCRAPGRGRGRRSGWTRCSCSRLSPIRMTEPLPNCFSIWPSAASSALSRSFGHLSLLFRFPALFRLLSSDS